MRKAQASIATVVFHGRPSMKSGRWKGMMDGYDTLKFILRMCSKKSAGGFTA